MKRLYIHAANVHQGGGKALLDAILQSEASEYTRFLIADTRMNIAPSVIDEKFVKRVAPSLSQRFKAEAWLGKSIVKEDTLLCFGNLPPLFRSQGRVVVFVQNKYLLENTSLSNFSWKTRLRIEIERLWFITKAKYVDEFIVQTPTMKAALQARLSGLAGRKMSRADIKILPFVKSVGGYSRRVATVPDPSAESKSFMYVASGEPHKNHRELIEAWCVLSVEGLLPELVLTLDGRAFAELCDWIDQKKSAFGLRINNMGVLTHDQVRRLYDESDALINPSTFESLGLPLIEARQAGLPVLAPELDYIRDVLDPDETFDPASPRSIARAVKRFMGISDTPLPLMNATGFIEQVLNKVK